MCCIGNRTKKGRAEQRALNQPIHSNCDKLETYSRQKGQPWSKN